MNLQEILRAVSLDAGILVDAGLPVRSPIDGKPAGHLRTATAAEAAAAIDRAQAAFLRWRNVPAPVRGELVRLLGDQLRRHKEALGRLVTLETGKILSEGLGEVQEMIDICDFAVGLSRQLHGLTIASERPGHRMMETWHPAGVVGVISAFNFPVAVWSWNSALALVCGDSVVWKPSEKAPLAALACDALFQHALAEFARSHPDTAPPGLHAVLIGGAVSGCERANSASACLNSASQASAASGAFSEGFQTTLSPQTKARALFQDQTATGKLNAEITPTTPAGCQVSIIRWPGRSEAMVRP